MDEKRKTHSKKFLYLDKFESYVKDNELWKKATDREIKFTWICILIATGMSIAAFVIAYIK